MEGREGSEVSIRRFLSTLYSEEINRSGSQFHCNVSEGKVATSNQ